MAGGVGDPPHAGLIVLREEDPDAARAAAESFVAEDPYQPAGLVDELARRALPQRHRLTGPSGAACSMPRPCPGPAASPRRPCGRGRSARSWQCAHGREGPFLVAAAPGAGKTRPALEHARELLKAGAVRRVAVVCPTTPLTRQWARAAARLGVHLVPDAGELRPPRDFSGVAVTYARVASVAERWARPVRRRDARHRRRGPSPRRGARVGRGLRARLRRDDALAAALGHALPLRPVPDPGRALRRRRRRARRLLQLRRRRPRRHLPPGHLRPLRRRAAVAQRRGRRRVVLRRRGHRARGGPALPHGDLARAGRRPAADPRRRRTSAWSRCAPAAIATRAASSSPPTASTPARWRKALRAITGRAPTVVLHTEARAAEKLQAFTRSTERWLVAVNMVSEGVDIPRLRVGVYATAAKTPLIFRQIVGRFVRTLPGRPLEHSWLFLPADPVLRAHAAEVERELRHVLRPPGEDEARARRARRAARDRARRGGGVRPGGGRRRAAARAVRPARPAPPPARRRSRRRSTSPTRRRCRPSSAARCCATSATAWWPTCAAARAAATPRSTAG